MIYRSPLKYETVPYLPAGRLLIIPATKYGRLCLQLGTSSEEDGSHTQSRPLKYWIPILRTRSLLSSSVPRVPPQERFVAKRQISMYLNR